MPPSHEGPTPRDIHASDDSNGRCPSQSLLPLAAASTHYLPTGAGILPEKRPKIENAARRGVSVSYQAGDAIGMTDFIRSLLLLGKRVGHQQQAPTLAPFASETSHGIPGSAAQERLFADRRSGIYDKVGSWGLQIRLWMYGPAKDGTVRHAD
jgi:hypothetical protein